MTLTDFLSYFINLYGQLVSYIFSIRLGNVRYAYVVVAILLMYLIIKYFMPKG